MAMEGRFVIVRLSGIRNEGSNFYKVRNCDIRKNYLLLKKSPAPCSLKLAVVREKLGILTRHFVILWCDLKLRTESKEADFVPLAPSEPRSTTH
jgi:hypothetical protein